MNKPSWRPEVNYLGPNTNIVLIITDALRADHLGCYGYDKPTSSNIDEIASKGLLFRNCYATANYTDPSLTSILSGRYPLHHGVMDHGLFCRIIRFIWLY